MRARLIPITLAVCLAAPAAGADGGVLTLKESFKRALTRSETLAMEGQDIKIAEAHYLQALGTVLPHIEVRANELLQDTAPVSGGDASVGQTFTRRSRPEVAVNLKQPLFQGLREFNALKASSAEKNRNTYQRDRARQILFGDVARAYYTVLELEDQLKIEQSLRATLQKRVDDLKNRILLGKSRESELLTTEAGLAQNEANQEETKGLILSARDFLAFLVGEPVTARLVDEFPVPKIAGLETFLDQGDRRPDVNASKEQVRLSKGRLDYEKGGRYPTVDVEANYYPYRVGFLSDIDWDVNFALTVPVFKGGATRGLIREAAAGLKQSELAHEESRRKADLEIRQAYHELQSARSREAALRKAEKKYGADYNSQLEEYTLGLVNNLDVLQSLRNWQESRLDTNRSHYETKLEYLGLLIATGDVPPKVLE
ncbi:MAG TPA: TolC family protein [bacterium]|nr:TolC family protein [bacterium]